MSNPIELNVDEVAHLARMQLDAREIELFRTQLQHILEHVATLSELDVTDIQPTAHARPLSNVFREDDVLPGLAREDILANAPQERAGLFVVPKIIE
jgi:aspartyl-tRNA(Asn)/glutamyl-tRNA(Gln) amidotransferase subunit C